MNHIMNMKLILTQHHRLTRFPGVQVQYSHSILREGSCQIEASDQRTLWLQARGRMQLAVGRPPPGHKSLPVPTGQPQGGTRRQPARSMAGAAGRWGSPRRRGTRAGLNVRPQWHAYGKMRMEILFFTFARVDRAFACGSRPLAGGGVQHGPSKNSTQKNTQKTQVAC